MLIDKTNDLNTKLTFNTSSLPSLMKSQYTIQVNQESPEGSPNFRQTTI